MWASIPLELETRCKNAEESVDAQKQAQTDAGLQVLRWKATREDIDAQDLKWKVFERVFNTRRESFLFSDFALSSLYM